MLQQAQCLWTSLIDRRPFKIRRLSLAVVIVVNKFFESISVNSVLLAVILATSMFGRPASAQTSLSNDQLATVLTVVNMYLLDDREPPIIEPIGERVDLDLTELSNSSFNATQSNLVYAAFELQEEAIEICFDLTTISGDFIVEVNGDVVQASEGTDNCYVIPESQQRLINYVEIIAVGSGANIAIDRFELAPAYQEQLGLQKVTRGGWNERAVRKVLKVFAFGGHATDAQIQTWADMYASDAITEMLNFDEHNSKLSPLALNEVYTDSANENLDLGTFRGWLAHISDPSSNIPIPSGNRDSLGIDGYQFDDAYNRMITVRGLNPFRQRIGFWETNYHLAVNRDAGVSREQVVEYYDLIMEAHEAGLPYHQVMGVAAKSAAVAMQYGHRNNEWNEDTGECECNDDFAREIHQLYYGIFGEGDPNHEDETIPETAKMLTGMPVPYISNFGFDIVVDFADGIADEEHHLNPVDIFTNLYGLGAVAGADAAIKIDNLMPLSMQHPESLQNLPIMIISVLADDNLTESAKTQLRNSWASMGVNRVLLDFIQAYAISELFHGPNQFKYFTTHERALYTANKHNLDNLEAYFGGGNYNGRAGKSVGGLITQDNAGDFFEPIHNVFGGQTSAEASDSALVFENNFNRQTDDSYLLKDAVQCDTCDIGDTDTSWEKKWTDVLPTRLDGNYYVEDVARWLWKHAVGNDDNYTELERAHLVSQLGGARLDDGEYPLDFNLIMCMIADYQVTESATDAPIVDILTGGTWDDYCRYSDDGGEYLPYELAELNAAYTGQDIANNTTMQSVLNDLGNQTLPLSQSDDDALRENTLERINNALGFIFSTPFIFAEGE